MRRPRTAVLLVFPALWAALAAWQYHEYCHEADTARAALRRQADTVQNTLVGGIRSHRRLGPFFEEQVQRLLEEVVRSEDVLAAAVLAQPGSTHLTAGDETLLALDEPLPPGDWLGPHGLRRTAEFEIAALPPGGMGPGMGGGRGWGRMARGLDVPDAFPAGGRFLAVVLLDRAPLDDALRHAAASRLTVLAAGTLGLAGLAWVWRTSLRLASDRAALDAQTRHLAELNQAAAGLAHETRNPLGLIRGWAQQLASASAPSPPRDAARAIVEECDRVTARINQFLAFARPADPRPESVDLAAALAELTALLEPDLAARGIALERDLPPGGAAIRADRDMLRRALFNLVQNAVEWSPKGGTVTVSVRRTAPARLRVEVADRGPGVPPDARPSLFVPYYTTRPGGTGLGLAIVRRLADAHGWTATYEPRPGGGSIFALDNLHAA